MKLKVWGTVLFSRGGASQQVRAVVAAKSQRAAAEAFDVSMYHLKQYASESGNAQDIQAAMSEPGTVFERPLDSWHGQYVKRKPRV